MSADTGAREPTAEDVRRAENYLRSNAERENWPRLAECADVIAALAAGVGVPPDEDLAEAARELRLGLDAIGRLVGSKNEASSNVFYRWQEFRLKLEPLLEAVAGVGEARPAEPCPKCGGLREIPDGDVHWQDCPVCAPAEELEHERALKEQAIRAGNLFSKPWRVWVKPAQPNRRRPTRPMTCQRSGLSFGLPRGRLRIW